MRALIRATITIAIATMTTSHRRGLLLAFVLLVASLASGVTVLHARDGERVVQQSAQRIRIEAGTFTQGASGTAITRALTLCQHSAAASAANSASACDAKQWDAERPARQVYLGAFSIDRTEVSNAQYRRCVAASVCAPAASSDDDAHVALPEQPVVQVSWQDAQRYCAYRGGSLPTEAQWERAARGGSARSFPWGEAWRARAANHGAAGGAVDDSDGYQDAAPVDAYAQAPSFYGLLNLAGNVWELTADRYGVYDPSQPHVDPVGPSASADEHEATVAHVIRGGSFRSPIMQLRVTARASLASDARRDDVGFRCAYRAEPRSVPKPPPDTTPHADAM